MFEQLATYFVKHYLGTYINVNSDQLSIGIWSGDISLKNIYLKPEAFKTLNLPIEIHCGYIGNVSIKIPWRTLLFSTAIIDCNISDVILLSFIKKGHHIDWVVMNHNLLKEKHKKIEKLNEIKYNEKSVNDAESTILKKLQLMFLRNLRLQILNVHVRIEDNGVLGHKTVSVGIMISKYLMIEHTNESKWVPRRMEIEKTSKKKMAITNFLGYVDPASEMFCQYPMKFYETRTDLLNTMKTYFEETMVLNERLNIVKNMTTIPSSKVNEAYLTTTNKKENAIIFSIDVTAALSICLLPQVNDFKHPALAIDISIPIIICNITESQILIFIEYWSYSIFVSHASRFLKYRPGKAIVDEPLSWWKFALNALIGEQLITNHKQWLWKTIKAHRNKTKDYINLHLRKIFHRCLNNITIVKQTVPNTLIWVLKIFGLKNYSSTNNQTEIFNRQNANIWANRDTIYPLTDGEIKRIVSLEDSLDMFNIILCRKIAEKKLVSLISTENDENYQKFLMSHSVISKFKDEKLSLNRNPNSIKNSKFTHLIDLAYEQQRKIEQQYHINFLEDVVFPTDFVAYEVEFELKSVKFCLFTEKSVRNKALLNKTVSSFMSEDSTESFKIGERLNSKTKLLTIYISNITSNTKIKPSSQSINFDFQLGDLICLGKQYSLKKHRPILYCRMQNIKDGQYSYNHTSEKNPILTISLLTKQCDSNLQRHISVISQSGEYIFNQESTKIITDMLLDMYDNSLWLSLQITCLSESFRVDSLNSLQTEFFDLKYIDMYFDLMPINIIFPCDGDYSNEFNKSVVLICVERLNMKKSLNNKEELYDGLNVMNLESTVCELFGLKLEIIACSAKEMKLIHEVQSILQSKTELIVGRSTQIEYKGIDEYFKDIYNERNLIMMSEIDSDSMKLHLYHQLHRTTTIKNLNLLPTVSKSTFSTSMHLLPPTSFKMKCSTKSLINGKFKYMHKKEILVESEILEINLSDYRLNIALEIIKSINIPISWYKLLALYRKFEIKETFYQKKFSRNTVFIEQFFDKYVSDRLNNDSTEFSLLLKLKQISLFFLSQNVYMEHEIKDQSGLVGKVNKYPPNTSVNDEYKSNSSNDYSKDNDSTRTSQIYNHDSLPSINVKNKISEMDETAVLQILFYDFSSTLQKKYDCFDITTFLTYFDVRLKLEPNDKNVLPIRNLFNPKFSFLFPIGIESIEPILIQMGTYETKKKNCLFSSTSADERSKLTQLVDKRKKKESCLFNKTQLVIKKPSEEYSSITTDIDGTAENKKRKFVRKELELALNHITSKRPDLLGRLNIVSRKYERPKIVSNSYRIKKRKFFYNTKRKKATKLTFNSNNNSNNISEINGYTNFDAKEIIISQSQNDYKLEKPELNENSIDHEIYYDAISTLNFDSLLTEINQGLQLSTFFKNYQQINFTLKRSKKINIFSPVINSMAIRVPNNIIIRCNIYSSILLPIINSLSKILDAIVNISNEIFNQNSFLPVIISLLQENDWVFLDNIHHQPNEISINMSGVIGTIRNSDNNNLEKSLHDIKLILPLTMISLFDEDHAIADLIFDSSLIESTLSCDKNNDFMLKYTLNNFDYYDPQVLTYYPFVLSFDSHEKQKIKFHYSSIENDKVTFGITLPKVTLVLLGNSIYHIASFISTFFVIVDIISSSKENLMKNSITSLSKTTVTAISKSFEIIGYKASTTFNSTKLKHNEKMPYFPSNTVYSVSNNRFTIIIPQNQMNPRSLVVQMGSMCYQTQLELINLGRINPNKSKEIINDFAIESKQYIVHHQIIFDGAQLFHAIMNQQNSQLMDLQQELGRMPILDFILQINRCEKFNQPFICFKIRWNEITMHIERDSYKLILSIFGENFADDADEPWTENKRKFFNNLLEILKNFDEKLNTPQGLHKRKLIYSLNNHCNPIFTLDMALKKVNIILYDEDARFRRKIKYFPKIIPGTNFDYRRNLNNTIGCIMLTNTIICLRQRNDGSLTNDILIQNFDIVHPLMTNLTKYCALNIFHKVWKETVDWTFVKNNKDESNKRLQFENQRQKFIRKNRVNAEKFWIYYKRYYLKKELSFKHLKYNGLLPFAVERSVLTKDVETERMFEFHIHRDSYVNEQWITEYKKKLTMQFNCLKITTDILKICHFLQFFQKYTIFNETSYFLQLISQHSHNNLNPLNERTLELKFMNPQLIIIDQKQIDDIYHILIIDFHAYISWQLLENVAKTKIQLTDLMMHYSNKFKDNSSHSFHTVFNAPAIQYENEIITENEINDFLNITIDKSILTTNYHLVANNSEVLLPNSWFNRKIEKAELKSGSIQLILSPIATQIFIDIFEQLLYGDNSNANNTDILLENPLKKNKSTENTVISTSKGNTKKLDFDELWGTKFVGNDFSSWFVKSNHNEVDKYLIFNERKAKFKKHIQLYDEYIPNIFISPLFSENINKEIIEYMDEHEMILFEKKLIPVMSETWRQFADIINQRLKAAENKMLFKIQSEKFISFLRGYLIPIESVQSMNIEFPLINMKIEANESYIATPLLSIELATNAKAKNWSTTFSINMRHQMEIAYHNGKVNIWEPFLEPFDDNSRFSFNIVYNVATLAHECLILGQSKLNDKLFDRKSGNQDVGILSQEPCILEKTYGPLVNSSKNIGSNYQINQYEPGVAVLTLVKNNVFGEKEQLTRKIDNERHHSTLYISSNQELQITLTKQAIDIFKIMIDSYSEQNRLSLHQIENFDHFTITNKIGRHLLLHFPRGISNITTFSLSETNEVTDGNNLSNSNSQNSVNQLKNTNGSLHTSSQLIENDIISSQVSFKKILQTHNDHLNVESLKQQKPSKKSKIVRLFSNDSIAFEYPSSCLYSGNEKIPWRQYRRLCDRIGGIVEEYHMFINCTSEHNYNPSKSKEQFPVFIMNSYLMSNEENITLTNPIEKKYKLNIEGTSAIELARQSVLTLESHFLLLDDKYWEYKSNHLSQKKKNEEIPRLNWFLISDTNSAYGYRHTTFRSPFQIFNWLPLDIELYIPIYVELREIEDHDKLNKTQCCLHPDNKNLILYQFQTYQSNKDQKVLQLIKSKYAITIEKDHQLTVPLDLIYSSPFMAFMRINYDLDNTTIIKENNNLNLEVSNKPRTSISSRIDFNDENLLSIDGESKDNVFENTQAHIKDLLDTFNINKNENFNAFSNEKENGAAIVHMNDSSQDVQLDDMGNYNDFNEDRLHNNRKDRKIVSFHEPEVNYVHTHMLSHNPIKFLNLDEKVNPITSISKKSKFIFKPLLPTSKTTIIYMHRDVQWIPIYSSTSKIKQEDAIFKNNQYMEKLNHIRCIPDEIVEYVIRRGGSNSPIFLEDLSGDFDYTMKFANVQDVEIDKSKDKGKNIVKQGFKNISSKLKTLRYDQERQKTTMILTPDNSILTPKNLGLYFTPIVNIHLLPPLTVFNMLPYDIQLNPMTDINEKIPKMCIRSGYNQRILWAHPFSTKFQIRINNYLNANWVGKIIFGRRNKDQHNLNNLSAYKKFIHFAKKKYWLQNKRRSSINSKKSLQEEEFFDRLYFVNLHSIDNERKYITIVYQVMMNQSNLSVTLYAPYLILNKTGMPLQYFVEYETHKFNRIRSKTSLFEITSHPADYKHPVILPLIPSEDETNHSAMVRIGNSLWSEKFSMEAVGSSGILTCIPINTRWSRDELQTKFKKYNEELIENLNIDGYYADQSKIKAIFSPRNENDKDGTDDKNIKFFEYPLSVEKYELCLKIELDSTGKAKIITLKPRHLIYNHLDSHEIEVSQTLAEQTIWKKIGNNCVEPFWPIFRNEKTYYRLNFNQMILRYVHNKLNHSVPFWFQKDHETVLQIKDDRIPAIVVSCNLQQNNVNLHFYPFVTSDISHTQKLSKIERISLQALIRIINLLPIHTVRYGQLCEGQKLTNDLPANSTTYFTWPKPTDKRIIGWTIRGLPHPAVLKKIQGQENSPEGMFVIDQLIQEDGVNEIFLPDFEERIIYIVSFLDFHQRVILFTSNLSHVSLARNGNINSMKRNMASVNLRIEFYFIGLSLVDELKKKEIAYCYIDSSPIVWEGTELSKNTNLFRVRKTIEKIWKNHKRKPLKELEYVSLSPTETKCIETGYRRYLENLKNGEVTENEIFISGKMKVNYNTQIMLAPYVREIRRKHIPALYVNCRFLRKELIMNFSLYRLQVDNPDHHSVFPVILQHKTLDNYEDIQWKPLFNLSLWKSATTTNIEQVKYFHLDIQDLTLKIDNMFILSILYFFQSSTMKFHKSIHHSLQKDLCQNDLSFYEEYELTNVNRTDSQTFYYRFAVSPINISVTFMLHHLKRNETNIFTNNPIINIILRPIGNALGNVEDVVFKLNKYERSHKFLNWIEIFEEIRNQYKQAIVQQLYFLIFGMNIFGNPSGWLKGMGEGIESLLYEPYRGAKRGPTQMAKGFYFGVKSFFGHTLGVSFGALAAITGTLGNGVAALTINKEFQKNRILNRYRNPNVREDFSDGTKRLILSIADGLIGLIRYPLEERKRKKNKYIGLSYGVFKGTTGCILMPFSAFIDLVTITLASIKKLTLPINHDVQMRSSRYIKNCGIVSPYNRRESEGNCILALCNSQHLFSDIYIAHIYLSDDHRNVLMVTNRRIMFLNKGSVFGEWTIEWEYDWQELSELPNATIDGIMIIPIVKHKRWLGEISYGKFVPCFNNPAADWICEKAQQAAMDAK
ncbi:hypothetical protein SNEBB_004675 [Seison nebaliae]|nr:hypothetical protein SNEBB_004675 [Seison nebaliae]